MSTLLVHTWVDGLPKTKGSMRGIVAKCEAQHDPGPPGRRSKVHGLNMVESVDNEHWRQEVARRCREDYIRRTLSTDPEPVTGPVLVRMVFMLPSMTNDVDKMARLVLDSIATIRETDARVIADDVQVVEILATKYVATDGDPTGAYIEIHQFSDVSRRGWYRAARRAIQQLRQLLGEDSPPPKGL